jgi:flagellar biosynthesis protein FliP
MSETSETPDVSKTLDISKTPEPIKTQSQALQILVTALQLAQSRGAFKIGESARISEAIVLFRGPTE